MIIIKTKIQTCVSGAINIISSIYRNNVLDLDLTALYVHEYTNFFWKHYPNDKETFFQVFRFSCKQEENEIIYQKVFMSDAAFNNFIEEIII